MATYRVENRPVEKTNIVEEKQYILTLSEDEVSVLKLLLGKVRGTNNSPRKFTQAIYDVIPSCVQKNRFCNLQVEDRTSIIDFKDFK